MTDAVLIGNGTAAVRALRALKESGVNVSLVLADHRDDGTDNWRLSLVKAAREAGYESGVSLLQPRNPNSPDALAAISAASPRVIFSVQCASLLRPPLVCCDRWWVVNWHNAPLPLLRGCDPFSWAILDGLEVMGVSLHLIEDEGIDSGAILAQSLWSVSEDTTAWDLYLQSLDKGDELLRRVAEQIVHRRITPQPQDGRFSSYHPPNQIDFRQTQINWAVPAKALSVWIRARVFPPLQLPWFSWQGEEVKVIRCRAAGACRGQAGAVMTTSPLVIATARGGVEVMEVQWKDEVMSGSMWADRAQLAVGTVFSFRGQ